MLAPEGPSVSDAALFRRRRMFGNGSRAQLVQRSEDSDQKVSRLAAEGSLLLGNSVTSDATQLTSIPNGSLGQVVYDQLGVAGDGQTMITIDFELVEE